MHRRLRGLKSSKAVHEKFEKLNFRTCEDLLTKTDVDLMRLLDTGPRAVNDIVTAACQYAAPKPCTVLDMWHSSEKHRCHLVTSLGELDTVLKHGFMAGTITEITGPSGCGKTQLSIQLAVVAVLSLGGSVIYIDTEAAFSAERWMQVAQCRFPQHFSSEQQLVDMAKQVHVYVESTCSSLWDRLQSLEEDIIKKRACLVVVDSIASLVRKEFNNQGWRTLIERTKLLSKEASMLKRLAEDFAIPIVVTNQITTRYTQTRPISVHVPRDNAADLIPSEDDGFVTAALGNTWSHCVNTRLILQYIDNIHRQILIAKSPVAPFASFVYRVEDKGLVLTDSGGSIYEGTDPGLQNIKVQTSVPQAGVMY